jgi:hypothetical protein
VGSHDEPLVDDGAQPPDLAGYLACAPLAFLASMRAMLANTTRLLRLCLIAGMSVAAVTRPWHEPAAHAAGDDDDDDGGDDDGGDDDKADKGGDDDDGGGGGDEDDDEGASDENQPPVTAGGLYTKKTYPQAELQRPLTLSKGMTEVKAGLGFDLSSDHAFESVGALVEGHFGIADNVEIQAGLKGIYNFKQLDVFAAFEGSIVYDLVDIRLAPRFSYCSPGGLDKDGKVLQPTSCAHKDGALHLDVGFPFRYAPKPQIGIIALNTLFTIDTEGSKGAAKPDLTPSVGIIVQPIPIVAVLVQAQAIIADFKTDAGHFRVPATATVQVSPTNAMDFGAEFTLLNIKADSTKDAMGNSVGGPFAERFLLFFGQLRL